MICEIVGYEEEKIIYDQSKYVGATSKVLNIDKAKEKLNSNYKVCALNIGLERTIKWFYESKSWEKQKSNS